MNADHLWDLTALIHTTGTRSASRFALAQTDDQLLAQFTDQQGIDRVVDRLATDVGISEAGHVHTAELAGNLPGRQTLTKHVSRQFETLGTWHCAGIVRDTQQPLGVFDHQGILSPHHRSCAELHNG